MTNRNRMADFMLSLSLVIIALIAWQTVSQAAATSYTRDEIRIMEEQGVEIPSATAGGDRDFEHGEVPLIDSLPDEDVLLIPDSGADNIGIYDPYDGTLMGIFVSGFGSFNTPICAIPGPDSNIYVSDQVTDGVYVFDKYGNYLLTYADASDGLNNVRGIAFRYGNLFVTSGDDYVAEFSGPHSRLPDFISSGCDPFDIYFIPDGRALVSNITGTNAVRLYNADGSYASDLLGVSFPEQIQFDLMDSNTFLNASFTSNMVNDFDIAGTVLQATPWNSGRGVYRLGNGNLLVTNGSGVFEVTPGTGAIVEQQNTGAARFIELYRPPVSGGLVDINLWPTTIIDTVLMGNISMSYLTIANVGESILIYGLHSNQSWLTIAPDTGTVFPSRVDSINVLCYTDSLTPGTYSGQITVLSNDPDEPVLLVACTLSVQEQSGIGDHGSDLPDQFALLPNYPNPFNPSTRITFALPTASSVDLAIYDLLGRRVRTLVDANMTAGYFDITWNGLDERGGQAASGVYLYVLRAGEFSQSRKMTLTK